MLLEARFFTILLLLWISTLSTVLCSIPLQAKYSGHRTNTGNNGLATQQRQSKGYYDYEDRYFRPPQSYGPRQQNRPQAQGSNTERLEGSQCGIAGIYRAAIPAGETKVDHFNGFQGEQYGGSLKECAKQCCKLGPEICQYAWVFTGKCFAVGCTEENSRKCVPKTLSTLTTSIYVALHYPANYEPAVSSSLPVVDTTQTPQVSQAVSMVTMAATPLNTSASSSPPPTPSSPPPSTPSLTPGHTISSNTPSHASALPSVPTGTTNGLVISFAGDINITLPRDSTQIFSSTWPRPKSYQRFIYTWEKLSGPNQGSFSDKEKELDLSGLVAGVYVFKLTVENLLGRESGEALVNVTVHPPARDNTPPIPVISPSPHTTVFLPKNSALFDASGSHDDLSFDTLTFQWEEVEGPVADSALTSNSPVLQLIDLKEGDYKYKLTVTDADGSSAMTYATVTVKPEPYYPPQALAGKDKLLKLPNNQVTLDGSQSTAFKGELQYSWEKLLGPGSVDMKGANTPYLHLKVSSVGDYLFSLTVTDSQGQSSSSNVAVVVTPEHNLPPIADAGADVTVAYPKNTATLNASASKDDFRIDIWSWTQLSGPEDVSMTGGNTSILLVKGLHIDEDLGSPTEYQFQVRIWDYHNLTDSANVTIIYRKDPKVPPHANAGVNINITLPQSTVVLNGSSSHDDFGISSYKWMRSETSPAAGLVINGSDSQPVLIMSGLVQGTYNYTLTITNRQGMVSEDTINVQVLPNSMDDYLLEVHLDGNASIFSVIKQRQLERVLSLILDDIDVDYDIVITKIQPFDPHIAVEFYAIRRDNHAPLNSTLAYAKLTDKGQDYYYPNSNFHFVKINMKVCRLPCSGHGVCDQKTHKCSCMRYWMENPIKAHYGKRETNCAWSIFYVALAVLLCVAALLFLLWLACYCCMRKRRIARTKRRVRYAILDRNSKDAEEEAHQMLPRYQQTSLMVSESETEEEILFESKKDEGGSGTKNKNGTVPPANVSIRTNNKLPNGRVPAPGHSPGPSSPQTT